MDKAAALRLINQKDAERLEYALFSTRAIQRPQTYDLVLNTSRLSIEEAMALILCLLEERGIVRKSPGFQLSNRKFGRLIADRAATEAASKNDRHKQSGNVFANESEEFADPGLL